MHNKLIRQLDNRISAFIFHQLDILWLVCGGTFLAPVTGLLTTLSIIYDGALSRK